HCSALPPALPHFAAAVIAFSDAFVEADLGVPAGPGRLAALHAAGLCPAHRPSGGGAETGLYPAPTLPTPAPCDVLCAFYFYFSQCTANPRASPCVVCQKRWTLIPFASQARRFGSTGLMP